MLITLYQNILENTNRYNRNKNNKWFAEKFNELKQYLPFEVSTLSEVKFIIDNDLTEWPKCKVCNSDVKKIEKVYCSTKCSANCSENKKRRNNTLKETLKTNPEIIKKRTQAWLKTVSEKSDEEIADWKTKMSISGKQKELNMTERQRKERSNNLSLSLINYFAQLTPDEMNNRSQIINEGRIKNDSFNKISKSLKETYKKYSKEIQKKKNTTRIKNGTTAKKNSCFNMYEKLVRFYSEKTYIEFFDEINPDNVTRGKYTNSNLYHLDHIISIKDGFENNIPVYIIASKYNLQMLLVEENCSKNKSSGMLLEDLLKNF